MNPLCLEYMTPPHPIAWAESFLPHVTLVMLRHRQRQRKRQRQCQQKSDNGAATTAQRRRNNYNGAATTAQRQRHSNNGAANAMEFSDLSKPALTMDVHSRWISLCTLMLDFIVHTKSKNRVFTTVNVPAGKPIGISIYST